MAWEVGWALILGFLLSGIVQAWIPRGRMEQTLGRRDLRTLGLATGLGAGSSSCSYAATAIARSMFVKGASLAAAMVFQFASTNLVFEIGIVLWIFPGWQFTLAEFVGGILLVTLTWAGVRLFVTRRLEAQARAHAEAAEAGHQHTMAGAQDVPWRVRLTSVASWSDVGHNFRADWQMLWKEITAGLLDRRLRRTAPEGLLQRSLPDRCTRPGTPARERDRRTAGRSPLIRLLGRKCAACGGALGRRHFVFRRGRVIYADLIVVPIILIYGRFYGWRLTRRLVAIMFATTVIAALAVHGLFSGAGIVPDVRPSIESITERGIQWNYTTVLNNVFFVVADRADRPPWYA